MRRAAATLALCALLAGPALGGDRAPADENGETPLERKLRELEEKTRDLAKKGGDQAAELAAWWDAFSDAFGDSFSERWNDRYGDIDGVTAFLDWYLDLDPATGPVVDLAVTEAARYGESGEYGAADAAEAGFTAAAEALADKVAKGGSKAARLGRKATIQAAWEWGTILGMTGTAIADGVNAANAE